MSRLFAYGLVCAFTFGVVSMGNVTRAADATEHECALEFEAQTIDGQTVDLHDYEGKVVLIVNVASKCGLTPQYSALQELYEKYKDKGLVVIGFPCNQFGGQEPGTAEEIKQFCSTKYSVTFPMMSKVDVNDADAAPIYKFLTSQETEPVGSGPISWNFEKFLIGKDGQLIHRFAPRTKPSDPTVVSAIEAAL